MHRAKTERKKYLNSETKRWCSHQILRQKIIESLQQIRSTGFGILFPGHSRYHQIISMEYESEIKLNRIQLNSIKTKVFPLKYTEKGLTRWKRGFTKSSIRFKWLFKMSEKVQKSIINNFQTKWLGLYDECTFFWKKIDLQ